MRWNPFHQCSWPPEDVAIERFRTHTFEKAQQIIGQDLARVEKFTTSVQDGIDIRETLRNWHTGDIYVKNFPPNRGSVDVVVMLFRLTRYVRVFAVGKIKSFERAQLGEEIQVSKHRCTSQADPLPTRFYEQVRGGEMTAPRADEVGDGTPRPRQPVASVCDGFNDPLHFDTNDTESHYELTNRPRA